LLPLGGFCFEQNTLLWSALLSLGFEVAPLLCRVRFGKAADQPTGWTHMALRVSLPDGRRFLADVGFAGTNSVAPIEMDVTGLQQLPEAHFQLTAEGGVVTLARQLAGDSLRPLYLFHDEAASQPDLLMSNWYSCTSPDARFCTQFFTSRVVGDEGVRHHILNGEYVIRGADGVAEKTQIADKKQLLRLLDTVFGLAPAETEGLDRYLPSAK
jgi:N-hydroxyarylamine O-acetyltransferase